LKARVAAGIPTEKICSRASARPKTSCAMPLMRTSFAINIESSPSWNCVTARRRDRPRARWIRLGSNPRRSIPASHGKSRKAKVREQVTAYRSDAPAKSTPAPGGDGTPGIRVTARRAYRQPANRLVPTKQAFRLLGRIVQTCAPMAKPHMSISAAVLRYSQYADGKRAGARQPMPRWSSG